MAFLYSTDYAGLPNCASAAELIIGQPLYGQPSLTFQLCIRQLISLIRKVNVQSMRNKVTITRLKSAYSVIALYQYSLDGVTVMLITSKTQLRSRVKGVSGQPIRFPAQVPVTNRKAALNS